MSDQIWSDPSLMIDMLTVESFSELLRLADPNQAYHPTENPWVRRPDWFLLKSAQLLLHRDVAARLRAFHPRELDGTFSLNYRGVPITLWFHPSFDFVARNRAYDIGTSLDRFATHLAGLGPEPACADTATAGLLDSASTSRKVGHGEAWRWASRAPSRTAPGGAHSPSAAEALATRIMDSVALRDGQNAERDEALAAAIVSDRAARRAEILALAEQWFPAGGWS